MTSDDWYPGKNLGGILLKNESKPNLPEWFPDWLYDQLTPKEVAEYRDLIYWSNVLTREDLKQIPKLAYHVSPEPEEIMREGFKTATELGKQSFGGHGTYVSVTTYDNALDYLQSMRMATRIVNGTVNLEQLRTWITSNCGAQVFETLYADSKRRREIYPSPSWKGENSPEFLWEMFEKLSIYSPTDALGVCKVLYMGTPTALRGKRPEEIKIVEVQTSPSLKFRHEYNIHDEEMGNYYTYNKHEAEWRIWDPRKANPVRVTED